MRRTLLWFLGILFVVAMIAMSAAAYEYHRYGHVDLIAATGKAEFDVRKGQGATTLGPTLKAAGIAVDDWRLALAWRLRRDSDRIKAGGYEFSGPLTLRRLLDDLVQGQPARERTVTLIEGWTFQQFRATLAKAKGLVVATAGLTDREVLEKLGIAETHPEGWFAPDSYRYAEGSTDLEVLGKAHQLQRQRLAEAWESRTPGLKLASPNDLLILASIIEKETSRANERALISAVFHNRLRIGMLLQSDPTTIYGMGESFDGNLRKRDLRTDQPYNTYVRAGLTPTPISMPGKAALVAAAQPETSQALYFVSRGDGTSHFSNDLRSHNRAVDKFQRNR